MESSFLSRLQERKKCFFLDDMHDDGKTWRESKAQNIKTQTRLWVEDSFFFAIFLMTFKHEIKIFFVFHDKFNFASTHS